MGGCEIGKLHALTFSKKITQKIKHRKTSGNFFVSIPYLTKNYKSDKIGLAFVGRIQYTGNMCQSRKEGINYEEKF